MRVVAGVRRCRRRRLDAQQRGAPTDGVEQLGAAQLLGDGDRVDGLALAVQGHDRFVDVDVRGLVVVARLDVRLDGRGYRIAREQHRSEERLFGFEVVRRGAPRPLPPRVIDRLDHAVPFLPPGPPGPRFRLPVPPLPVRRPSQDASFRILVGSACGSIERFPCGNRALASTTLGTNRSHSPLGV